MYLFEFLLVALVGFAIVAYLLLKAWIAATIQFDDLQARVRALYYAAHWTPDRECDAGKLWQDVRDAAGFDKGEAPIRYLRRTAP